MMASQSFFLLCSGTDDFASIASTTLRQRKAVFGAASAFSALFIDFFDVVFATLIAILIYCFLTIAIVFNLSHVFNTVMSFGDETMSKDTYFDKPR